jgi:hypothetical protein
MPHVFLFSALSFRPNSLSLIILLGLQQHLITFCVCFELSANIFILKTENKRENENAFSL